MPIVLSLYKDGGEKTGATFVCLFVYFLAGIYVLGDRESGQGGECGGGGKGGGGGGCGLGYDRSSNFNTPELQLLYPTKGTEIASGERRFR